MRLFRRRGWFAGFGAPLLVTVLLGLANPAQAAFPGRNGLLAVQPVKGSGVVLVKANGRGQRRTCAEPVVGDPVCFLARPQWSPDGRALVVEEPSLPPKPIAMIYPDGSCLVCTVFGAGGEAAFTTNPTLLAAVEPAPELQQYWLVEVGIDGLARQVLLSAPVVLSDPVWSSRGDLAVTQRNWIWVGSPENLRRLTRGTAPSWSPAGRRIAFDRQDWVMIARLPGRSVRRLVRGTAPAWSPDGRWVAFFDSRHRLRMVPAKGGLARYVGNVTGRTVDWQPLPTKPPAACPTLPGSTVIASSNTAIVSLTSGRRPGEVPGTFANVWAAMGCLRSTGRERLLTEEGPPGSAGSSNVTEAAVAGDYAALAINSVNPKPPTGFSASNLLIFDLRTGAGVPNRGGEGPFCNVGFAARCEIDQLVLGADAVSAVHSTVRDNGCTCTVEQIQASDSTGEHTLDSVTQSDGSPPALTNLTLTGDTLTWQHNGQLPSAQLQP